MKDHANNNLSEALTDRQKAILYLLFNNKTISDIALLLNVHESNIKRHIRLITKTVQRLS